MASNGKSTEALPSELDRLIVRLDVEIPRQRHYTRQVERVAWLGRLFDCILP